MAQNLGRQEALSEMDLILPQLEQMGVEVQWVTSAVTAIPRHWAKLSNLHLWALAERWQMTANSFSV